uniref:Reverse transcriptase domain-containing protein n=1 Tax=Tanacetum cinerariifolium TaxID=118510 RepID=A0A6L2J8U7_TANCI|nr:hypothetical protein [Tanacetum cinerariifolium]
MPEDGKSARTRPGREDCSPPDPPPISPEKDTNGDEKGKEKDELLKKPLESKPLEKVVVHDDHLDQTVTIEGNLTAECSLHRRHGHQKQNRAGNDKRRQRDIIDAQESKHEVKSQKCSFGMEEDTMAEDSPAQAKIDGSDDTLTEGENLEEQEATETQAPANLKAETDICKLYADGVSNKHGSRVGFRIATKIKVKNACICRFGIGSKPGGRTVRGKRKADALSKLEAVQCEGLTKGVLIEELNERSMDATEVNAIIEEAIRTWMTPIQEYIKKESYRKMPSKHEHFEKRYEYCKNHKKIGQNRTRERKEYTRARNYQEKSTKVNIGQP